MDKLRHHLMPMYSFDPNEDGDWESELLEDQDNEQHLSLQIEVLYNFFVHIHLATVCCN